MGIFSRLFNRRGSEDGELEQLEGEAPDASELVAAEGDESGERSVEEELPVEGERPSRDLGRKGILQLDPLDPADFEVRTKSGRKRLLSVREESDPPPGPVTEESGLEEIDEVEEVSEVLEVAKVAPAPPPPPPPAPMTVPKMPPLAIDVEAMFDMDSEPPEKPVVELAKVDIPAESKPVVAEETKVQVADEEFDFDAEIEREFAASLRRSSRPPRGDAEVDSVTTEADLNQVRELFHDMAATYVGQVRDFMLELRRAEAAAIWIPLCEPVVQRLRTMCETLLMPDVSSALEDFAVSLDRAKNTPTGVVQGVERDALLGAYDRLITLLPRAFETDDAGREGIIVELLLLQIPGVRTRTLEKLYRAGLHQFEAFFRADPGELAAVAGIEVALAEQIVRQFREYRQSVTGVLAEPEPGVERDRLVELVVQLREQQDGYEKASARWSDDAKADKRRLRRARLETLSQVYVVLARLGEVERVARMKKMGVEWQLKELEGYLRDFNAAAPV